MPFSAASPSTAKALDLLCQIGIKINGTYEARRKGRALVSRDCATQVKNESCDVSIVAKFVRSWKDRQHANRLCAETERD